MTVNSYCVFINNNSINGLQKITKNHMLKILLVLITTSIKYVWTEETSTTPSTLSTLGNLYRQARSEHYYASRYGTEGPSVSSGAIGIRGENEHRDAAYYQSRCITCDSNKSTSGDRGWRHRVRYDPYEDEYEIPIRRDRDRDRYDDYNDKIVKVGGYMYDRPRGPTLDYDRTRGLAYDHDRYDPYGKNDLSKPIDYPDRYDIYFLRNRYNDMRYDRNYDRFVERGNGYDNLNQRHSDYGNRYDPYASSSRYPHDDPYYSRYDRYDRYDRYNRYHHPSRYDQYDRYDPYEKSYYKRPHDDRNDRTPLRDGDDTRGYYSSGTWTPGYDKGYATAWNYAGGMRDYWRNPGYNENWKDLNRDRDTGPYRPRDYFYDSTIPPGGLRETSYLYDRAESSTKSDSTEREKPTSSPQTQDKNKVYKD